MTTAKRKKRPTLDRTKPVRSLATALGAPSTHHEERGARPRIEDAISRSVEVGYRVVDDYIQQGQRAAQRMSEGKLTAETIASEAQELSARIARYASDFFGAWVELLDLAAAGSAARQGIATPPAPAPPAEPIPAAPPPDRRPSSGTGLRVQVAAARPVEVALDLRPERVTGALRAHELRSADPRKPRLRDVAVRDGDGTPVLHIGVPDDHPAGAYEGLVLDAATNRPVGSVRVVLSAPARAVRKPSAKRRQ